MIKNITKNTIIAKNELIARSVWDRGTGLLFRKFEDGRMDAMIFDRCSSLHTFFMKYKFDVFFLDKSKKVITLYESASPWRIFNAKIKLFQHCTAIECPEYTINKTNTQVGDIIQWENSETEKYNENKISE